jgi:hypothetical protein
MKHFIVILLSILCSQYLFAKGIMLDNVQIPKDSPINHIIEEVIYQSDSISSSNNKLYDIVFTDDGEGFFVSVSLCKSNIIADADNYIGYIQTGNSTFVLRGDKNVHRFAREAKRKSRFKVESLADGLVVDGVIEWLFYIKGNNYTKLRFSDSW